MRKKLIFCGFSFLFAIAAGIYFNGKDVDANINVEKQAVLDKSQEKVKFFTSSTYDYNLPEELVGSHHYVFVAKVINQVENDYAYHRNAAADSDLAVVPLSTYAVEPLYDIKGELTSGGILLVEELDGYIELLDQEGSILQREPLQVGQTYLLFAREDINRSTPPLILSLGIEPNTAQLIASNETGKMRSSGVSDFADHALIKQFEKAYENEILNKLDIEGDTAYNRYSSQTQDE